MVKEILAPAGDENSAYAAINAGADAIYLGLIAFSARSSAANFDMPALEKLIARAHVFGVKIYVAMNTLVKEEELQSFINTAVEVWNIGADAIIIQDMYLGAYLKKACPDIVLHLSTQAGICNLYGAIYARECGFDRVILARETTLEDMREIAKVIQTEVFVQGALCTCFSGQCYLSSFAGGNSGNRGKCKQPCRKKYSIDRKGFESPAYRISLSDLSVGEDIEKLIDAGVTSFKIEGRMRRPEYVSAAVTYYKNILAGRSKDGDLSALKRTYNRGNYTKGLSFGQDKSLISSAVQGHVGEYVGVVSVESGKYICRTNISCGAGDGFKILRAGEEVGGAYFNAKVKGGIELKSSVRLKNGDKVFITTDAALNQSLLSKKRIKDITVSVRICAGEPPLAIVNGKSYVADFDAQKATGRPVTGEDIKNCFLKVDAYPFKVSFDNVFTDGQSFMPVSGLNAFRREVYAYYYAQISENKNVKIDNIYITSDSAVKQVKNTLRAVIAPDLNGVEADIGILKPASYDGSLLSAVHSFTGEKFLYLPPYLTGGDIERLKSLICAFDGIYSGGNYSIALARELKVKLFAGCGFNLSNSLSLAACPADYKAISKELTIGEAKGLARADTFYLTSGDIKVMDLIYCPFSKSCKECDRRAFYTLTDENKREFILRRYRTSEAQAGECRFELFNCANLISQNKFTGELSELTVPSKFYKNHTGGHTSSPVL